MANTPEGKVKLVIRRILEDHRVYVRQPVTGGFGASGQLDFYACVPPFGRYLGIEAKSIHTSHGKKGATALQQREIDQINAAGGKALVIDETNFDTLREAIRELQQS